MAVPVAPNNAPPIFGLSGVQHQRIKAFAGATYIPSYFNPVPVAEDLLGGITGVSYSEAISAQGGTSPYTFAVVSGSLPTSTALNSSTGIISGTPTASGTYTFTIEVTDTNGYIGNQVFQIIISNPVVSGGSFTFIS